MAEKEKSHEMVLRFRRNSGDAFLSIDAIRDIVSAKSPASMEILWNTVAALAGSPVHDREFLAMIINWVPRDGIPIMQLSKWISLGDRIDALEPVEGTFRLTDKDVKLITERLQNPDFRLVSAGPAIRGFLASLISAIGLKEEE